MTFSKKLCGVMGAAGLSLFAALPAWAQTAAAAAPTAPNAMQPVNINLGEGFLSLLSPDTQAAAQDFADRLQRDLRKTTPGVRG